ncbi:CBS domain-containing protein [Clostridium sp. D2Q-11]|uniref:CBS domain-containing protein n=1 Tax=Anaeromonas frigoriresistens TaxID=2683708 RepID=A0A942V0H9_9FIRM|nr:CBS domain-containing protein [Anaeromonas frigoriresistens]MBS4537812.1 CBS domain-containing protein [Anaeromonas frigoriresistens]
MKVREVMTNNVRSMFNNSSIKDVATEMKILNVGSIPITSRDNRAVGIVTDRDIVIRSLTGQGDVNSPISSIMTSELISVSPDTDIHEAARLMAEKQVRRLPVVENGNLVGIVSLGDLAVRDVYANEAGDALSNISLPDRNMR